MFFKPQPYKKYAAKMCKALTNDQEKFRQHYQLDSYDNWFYNPSSQVLRLYSGDQELFFQYIPVGTFSLNTNTWMWAWANKHSIEPSKLHTLKVKAFGEKKKYASLTEAHFSGDEFTGWELTSIAFDILGGIGTYRATSDHLESYFLLIKELTKQEVDAIEQDFVECSVHGTIRKAFVCQHLNKQQVTGFEEAFETYPGIELNENDDLQAWCSACEQERLRTDGWNEESMEFANIKLVCENCYFEIKELNLSN